MLERQRSLLTDHIDLLRDSVRRVKRLYPFHIDAWVVLPDRMHCVWTLPPDSDDFPVRWRLIKLLFSKGLPRCFFSSMLILVACSTVDVQESANISSRLAPEEGIALLSADLSKITDKEVYDCIGDRIRSKHPNLALVSAEMVRVDLYRKDRFVSPDMDSSFFETFNKLINNPYKRKKIESLNLRYLVFVNITPFRALEDIESSSWAPILYSKSGGITHGFIGCGAGQGGGGCLGLMAWDMNASLSTVVIDLQNLTIAAKLDVVAKGHGLMPALILPVPIPLAMPYSRACSEMTNRLEKIFLGK